MAARATGTADGLLKVAARAAFWKLNLTTLRQLGKHVMGSDFDQHMSLLETLRCLIDHALGCPENDIVAILRLRLSGPSFNTDEFLDLEGADAVFDKEDQEKAKTTVKKQTT